MAHIIDQSYVQDQDVTELKLHPNNPRRGDIPNIEESIEVNGFYGTVMAHRSTGFVIFGNHRLRAAIARGLTRLPTLWADVDDTQAQRILLTDNGSSDKATNDERELATMLAMLQASEGGLAGSSWTDKEYQALVASLAKTDNDPWSKPSDGSVLGLLDVSMGEPIHQVHRGDVYMLGPVTHTLDIHERTSGPHHVIVAPVATGWPLYAPYLAPGRLLLPYPGPYMPITRVGLSTECVFVQPELYLAGHLLDKWTAVFPDSITQLAGA